MMHRSASIFISITFNVLWVNSECIPPVTTLASDNGSGVETTLKVAFTETSEDTVCAEATATKPQVTDHEMSRQCHAFCGMEGINETLVIQMGSDQYGFNLEEMKDMCTTLTNPSSSQKETCKLNKGSITEIKRKTSTFVGAVATFKAEQNRFRAIMASETEKLQDQLRTPEFRKVMADSGDKVKELKKKFQAFTDGFGKPPPELAVAQRSLEETGTLLSDTVNSKLALFEKFVTDCNQMFLGLGAQSEFLLDVCPQGSLDCIEEEGRSTAHVGCCCGYNPVISEAHLIDGIDAKGLEDGKGYLGRRRLEGEDEEEDGIFEICAQGKKESQNSVKLAEDYVRNLGQEDILDDQERILGSQYESYYCKCKNVCDGGGLRRLRDDSLQEKHVSESSLPEEQVLDRDLQGRELQSEECPGNCVLDGVCTPDIITVKAESTQQEQTVKVAFSDILEKHMCDEMAGKDDVPGMREQCDQFCGTNAVAMQLGTEYYGFNKEEVESVCLPGSDGDGLLRFDPVKLKECYNWADAFRLVEVQTARFIRAFDLFEAERLLYIARVQNTTENIQKMMISEEFKKEMKKKIYKSTYLKGIIGAELENLKKQMLGLDDAIVGLKDSSIALNKSLRTNMPKVTSFLLECNSLFVGQGSQSEYLLDICAQQNVACLGNPLAGHVSCCCAHHPFVIFGKTPPAYAIPGLKEGGFQEAAGSNARVQAGTGLDRRRARRAQELNEYIDICAEAYEGGVAEIVGVYKKIEEMAKGALIKDRNDQLAAKYGSNYCPYFSPKIDDGSANGGGNGEVDDACTMRVPVGFFIVALLWSLTQN